MDGVTEAGRGKHISILFKLSVEKVSDHIHVEQLRTIVRNGIEKYVDAEMLQHLSESLV